MFQRVTDQVFQQLNAGWYLWYSVPSVLAIDFDLTIYYYYFPSISG